jgi:CcmD family protein
MTTFLTPDTTNYLIAGYLVMSVLIGGYVVSLIVRWRQAVQDWQEMQEDH